MIERYVAAAAEAWGIPRARMVPGLTRASAAEAGAMARWRRIQAAPRLNCDRCWHGGER